MNNSTSSKFKTRSIVFADKNVYLEDRVGCTERPTQALRLLQHCSPHSVCQLNLRSYAWTNGTHYHNVIAQKQCPSDETVWLLKAGTILRNLFANFTVILTVSCQRFTLSNFAIFSLFFCFLFSGGFKVRICLRLFIVFSLLNRRRSLATITPYVIASLNSHPRPFHGSMFFRFSTLFTSCLWLLAVCASALWPRGQRLMSRDDTSQYFVSFAYSGPF